MSWRVREGPGDERARRRSAGASSAPARARRAARSPYSAQYETIVSRGHTRPTRVVRRADPGLACRRLAAPDGDARTSAGAVRSARHGRLAPRSRARRRSTSGAGVDRADQRDRWSLQRREREGRLRPIPDRQGRPKPHDLPGPVARVIEQVSSRWSILEQARWLHAVVAGHRATGDSERRQCDPRALHADLTPTTSPTASTWMSPSAGAGAQRRARGERTRQDAAGGGRRAHDSEQSARPTMGG